MLTGTPSVFTIIDTSKVELTPEDLESIQANTGEAPDSKEEALESELDYLFSGPEVAERMSQLKNYFGMKGDEQFTKEHLHYAKEHYVSDTQVDNEMRLFFQAITPEREDEFVRLIHTSGI